MNQTETHYQTSVDLMSEHMYKVFQENFENNNTEISDAIYEEWMVDDKDPEDNDYEFMFINDLTRS